MKRDRKSTADIIHTDAEKLFTWEAQKILDLATERIEIGNPPSWENDISVYKAKIPPEFRKHLRRVRNRNSHVEPSRAAEAEISLSDFF